QIAEAIKEPAFWSSRSELAIATARTSRKIDGAYQDVLKWAREIESPEIFFRRLALSGAANDDMRTFVSTLRTHLQEAGAPSDDETVKEILGRLQILVFDFTAVGSASEELARDRARRVLPLDSTADASKLWSTLIDVALEIASNGGDRNVERLIETLKERGFQAAADRRLANVRKAIDEASRQSLADIRDRVGNVKLSRSERVAAVHEALDKASYIEIRGDAGVGKSGVLKHF